MGVQMGFQVLALGGLKDIIRVHEKCESECYGCIIMTMVQGESL